jgi:hypothetical protein
VRSDLLFSRPELQIMLLCSQGRTWQNCSLWLKIQCWKCMAKTATLKIISGTLPMMWETQIYFYFDGPRLAVHEKSRFKITKKSRVHFLIWWYPNKTFTTLTNLDSWNSIRLINDAKMKKLQFMVTTLTFAPLTEVSTPRQVVLRVGFS